jgi:hypothetical protein
VSFDCVCDYEPADFYVATIRKARKSYQCEECIGRIQPGEKYEHVTAKWEGSISTMRTCKRCRDLRQWVKNNVPCFCWAHGNLNEDAREAVEEACYRAPEETVGLRFGFRKRVILRDRFNARQRAAA